MEGFFLSQAYHKTRNVEDSSFLDMINIKEKEKDE